MVNLINTKKDVVFTMDYIETVNIFTLIHYIRRGLAFEGINDVWVEKVGLYSIINTEISLIWTKVLWKVMKVKNFTKGIIIEEIKEKRLWYNETKLRSQQ